MLDGNEVSGFLRDEKTVIAGGVLLLMAVGAVVTGLSSTGMSNQAATQEYRGGHTASLAASGDALKRTDSAGDGGSAGIERKRATSIDLEYEVPEVDSAMETISRRASDYNGYVESENVQKRLGDTGHITVRVPEQNLSEFLDSVESEKWELKSRNRNTQDLTDTYTEYKLELENKRQELRQLEQLMNRSEDTEDLIKIQERMSEIRSRVQFLENRLNDIDRRVDYTRVSFELNEPESLTSEFELDRAFRDSYQGIFTSLNWIIVGAGYLLPFITAGAVFYYGRRALRRREEGE